MSTCKETPSECELATILSRFNENLSKLDEFSNIILDKTCKITNYREPSPEDPEEPKQREGYVGEFDNALSRFYDYNSRLQEVIKGLVKIVG